MPSHLQTATIQAAILNVTSSVLAQLLTLYRASKLGVLSTPLNPLGLNYLAILQYLIVCLIVTPPNFLWQEFLEKSFPGYPVQKGKQKMKVDEDGRELVVQPKLNKKNTACKFALDQSIGAGMNLLVFLGMVNALRGHSFGICMETIRTDFWPIMMTGYKLWPLVSIFNYTLVPMERRVVVGSFVGLGWGVYLALKTAAPI